MKKYSWVLLAITLVFLTQRYSFSEEVTSADQIVFIASKGNELDTPCSIFVINSDGGQLTDLKVNTSSASDIARVPHQGNLIAVTGKDKEDYFFLVVDLQGKERCQIPIFSATSGGTIDSKVSWTLDGNAVSLVRIIDKSVQIVRFNILSQTEEAVVMTNLPDLPFGPVWSPDGKKLAFYQLDGTSYKKTKDLLTYNLICLNTESQEFPYKLIFQENGNPSNIAFIKIAQVHIFYQIVQNTLRWSADGNRLAFYSPCYPSLFPEDADLVQKLDEPTLYVFDFALSKLFRKEIKADFISDAVLSQNGKMVALTTVQGIFLWDIDNDEIVELINLLLPEKSQSGLLFTVPKYWGPARHLDWSPDDKSLVFHTSCQIFFLDLAARQATEIFCDPMLEIHTISWTR